MYLYTKRYIVACCSGFKNMSQSNVIFSSGTDHRFGRFREWRFSLSVCYLSLTLRNQFRAQKPVLHYSTD